jgi:hypothetical protein
MSTADPLVRDLIAEALSATIFGAPADTKSDVLRHFSPQYTQITDGSLSTFEDFLAHITHLRTVTTGGTVNVKEALRDGSMVADRHCVSVIHPDGTSSSFEVLLIGELDDQDRFLRVVETTRQLTGDQAHANLGTAAS